MFNARQLMIFYFYGTCNQKATIIQFQKLKEKAKTSFCPPYDPKINFRHHGIALPMYVKTAHHSWQTVLKIALNCTCVKIE